MNDDQIREEVRLLATKGKRKVRTEPLPSWSPPTLEDFEPSIWAMSFDQAVGNTGHAALVVHPAFEVPRFEPTPTRLDIGKHETCTTTLSDTRKGHVDTVYRACDLDTWVGDCLAFVGSDNVYEESWDDVHVFYEQPPVGPAMRPESSLLGMFAVVRNALSLGCPESHIHGIANSTMRRVLVGHQGKGKKYVTEAVKRYVPECATRGQGWTEHDRDAAAIALTGLYLMKSGELK